MKIAYIDIETTGLSIFRAGIIQIGCILEIDNHVKVTLNLEITPFPEDKWEDKARGMIIAKGKDPDDPKRDSPSIAYQKFTLVLDRLIDKFNPKDKFHFCGYNSNSFDMPFLRKFFIKNNDKFFGSYFFAPSLDVMLLAAVKMRRQRASLENFKLVTIARALGIEVDEKRLHDALYDIEITREMFKRLI